MLQILGTAKKALRDEAAAFITALGHHESNVAAMVLDQHIRLTVVIDAAPQRAGSAASDESSDDLDGNTVVTWNNGTTLIDVSVPLLPGDQGMLPTLLHELILHANVAYIQHRHAVDQGRVPVYPTTETAIDAAAKQEHADLPAWLSMIGYAAALGGAPLMNLAVFDSGTYGMGKRVLEMLLIQGTITERQAADYRKVMG